MSEKLTKEMQMVKDELALFKDGAADRESLAAAILLRGQIIADTAVLDLLHQRRIVARLGENENDVNALEFRAYNESENGGE